MKKVFVILGAIALLTLPVVVPHLAFAVEATSSSSTVTLYNPLGTTAADSDVRVILGRVIKGFLSIIGSLALLMFVYGGMLWMTSGGAADRIKKGKDVIVWSILGLGIIFSAYAVTNALIQALTTGSVTGTQ